MWKEYYNKVDLSLLVKIYQEDWRAWQIYVITDIHGYCTKYYQKGVRQVLQFHAIITICNNTTQLSEYGTEHFSKIQYTLHISIKLHFYKMSTMSIKTMAHYIKTIITIQYTLHISILKPLPSFWSYADSIKKWVFNYFFCRRSPCWIWVHHRLSL